MSEFFRLESENKTDHIKLKSHFNWHRVCTRATVPEKYHKIQDISNKLPKTTTLQERSTRMQWHSLGPWLVRHEYHHTWNAVVCGRYLLNLIVSARFYAGDVYPVVGAPQQEKEDGLSWAVQPHWQRVNGRGCILTALWSTTTPWSAVVSRVMLTVAFSR